MKICKWLSCEFAQICTNPKSNKLQEHVKMEECNKCNHKE